MALHVRRGIPSGVVPATIDAGRPIVVVPRAVVIARTTMVVVSTGLVVAVVFGTVVAVVFGTVVTVVFGTVVSRSSSGPSLASSDASAPSVGSAVLAARG
jgi:hypothetical protein